MWRVCDAAAQSARSQAASKTAFPARRQLVSFIARLREQRR
jgi:hypothetical protein